MNIKRYTARMLSRFKAGLDSWISLWRFLVYLEDLNFYEGLDGCETELSWSESSDDLDPPWQIEYQIFVNGVYDHSLALRLRRTIVYGTVTGPNTFSIVAVDTAGNRSEPAETTLDLICGP